MAEPDALLPGPDASPAILDAETADLFEAKDLAHIPDSASDGVSPPPSEAPDAKVQPLEVSSDLATNTPPLPKDVVVFTNKDFGAADAQCVAATSGWLSLVSTFLAEDQKCWADTDCTYVSFGDSCGMICVLPMNLQRIGEFGTQVYNYASANCSSCPSPASFPACAAPTTVYCNAGRCEYKTN